MRKQRETMKTQTLELSQGLQALPFIGILLVLTGTDPLHMTSSKWSRNMLCMGRNFLPSPQNTPPLLALPTRTAVCRNLKPGAKTWPHQRCQTSPYQDLREGNPSCRSHQRRAADLLAIWMQYYWLVAKCTNYNWAIRDNQLPYETERLAGWPWHPLGCRLGWEGDVEGSDNILGQGHGAASDGLVSL